jgi:hypothetical protein
MHTFRKETFRSRLTRKGTLIPESHFVYRETRIPLNKSRLCLSFESHSNQTHHYFHDKHQSELVISACDEDLSWIYNVSTSFERVFIYDKCGTLNSTSPVKRENVRVVSMQNVGSADGAYLRHITTRYHELAKYVVFTKGRNSYNANRMLSFLQNSTRGYFCPFTSLVLLKDQFYPNFKIKDYSFFRHNPNRKEKAHVYKGSGGTLRMWFEEVFGIRITIDLFKIAKLRQGRFCRGGYFAATRDIIRKHPLYAYQAIHLMQIHMTEEIDHYIERIWEALFIINKSISCELEKNMRIK